MLVDRAALLAQVSAGAIRAPLKHQFAFVVPFRQQVGKAAPIALFVDRDACVVAAGRAAGARDRASLATPPGSEKVPCGAVQRALSLIQCSSLSYDYPTGGKVRAYPFRPPSGPVIHPAPGSPWAGSDCCAGAHLKGCETSETEMATWLETMFRRPVED